jgi:rhamnosyl/mannosyltransferase
VLGVGRLIYYKGFDYLVRAMAHVDSNLLIVGDGPLRARLEEVARALGIHERVFFAGEIQNDAIAPYYHAADVFVLSSVARSEAFGIVQLEAMAAARPVVNTRIDSGVPFVSIDGVTGITVPPREPEALAAAITRLLDNPELRARYGAAATRRVREEFSLEAMASRTLDLYHDILPELAASASSDAPSKMLAL